MGKGRLEAFSDGVLAIIITIMVLDLKIPVGDDFDALVPLAPSLVCYLLSFIYVGIYWTNHHHLLHTAQKVNGAVLWANLHLLFWLSLVPFLTGWVAQSHRASVPTALYGVILLMAGVSYWILQETLIHRHGEQSLLKRAVGADVKGKASIVLYGAAIALAFVNQWYADAVYIGVGLMWLVPDRRIERLLPNDES